MKHYILALRLFANVSSASSSSLAQSENMWTATDGVRMTSGANKSHETGCGGFC